VAVVKNKTPDTLTLFAGRAWPTSTWDVVTPPEGYDDASDDEAYLFLPATAPVPKKSAAKGDK
jgi:hypothetical protein